ncbi:MAG: hypothetical protein ABJ275_04840 [Maricaulaceae bacterium]
MNDDGSENNEIYFRTGFKIDAAKPATLSYQGREYSMFSTNNDFSLSFTDYPTVRQSQEEAKLEFIVSLKKEETGSFSAQSQSASLKVAEKGSTYHTIEYNLRGLPRALNVARDICSQ